MTLSQRTTNPTVTPDRADAPGWYWGVTIRIDQADQLLQRLDGLIDEPGVHVQRPGTAHVTLLYAPPRLAGDCGAMAACAERIASRTEPFQLRLGGIGVFPPPPRTVAWMGIYDGTETLQGIRGDLCKADRDVLPYGWVPHCTLLYADSPEAWDTVRTTVEQAVHGVNLKVDVDALWVAGFPVGAHPADDLTYRVRVPLAS
jgi:2'-5' RNA ligase